MNQSPLQNPDLQPNKVIESQAVDCCPENNIQGNENRAIQGKENLGVLGDGNTVSQNSNNLNGFGSHFIKNIQADQISFINVTYLEAGSEEKLNGSQASVEKQEETNNKGKATFVLTGTIDIVDENFLKALEAHLRKKSKDAELTILKAEDGSIKITLEASQESLELLKNLFESGELTEVLDTPVEDVQILSESSDDDESSELDEKSRLVREILSHPIYNRKLNLTNLIEDDLRGVNLTGVNLTGVNLEGSDLRGANLTGANLTDANLKDADLTDAKLTDANLSTNIEAILSSNLARAILSTNIEANLAGAADLTRANLIGADLRGANLRGANLTEANLRGANLRGANLTEANLTEANLTEATLKNATVVNALFEGSVGITEDMKRQLEQRGAIFGDRPPVLVTR